MQGLEGRGFAFRVQNFGGCLEGVLFMVEGVSGPAFMLIG